MRNLKQGSQGDDVREFQKMLWEEGHFMGSTTGFFGAVTAKAVAEWQEKNGIASVANGGMVGMMTRKFLDNRCPPPIKPAATSTAQ
jgi:peptidoglycan hydrolase-like protein with peptidoglycan-binding domain